VSAAKKDAPEPVDPQYQDEPAEPKAYLPQKIRTRGLWCAYNADGSSFVVFSTEMAALRYMAQNHLNNVMPIEYGVPLLDQIK
jgi:hypothetical protein